MLANKDLSRVEDGRIVLPVERIFLKSQCECPRVPICTVTRRDDVKVILVKFPWTGERSTLEKWRTSSRIQGIYWRSWESVPRYGYQATRAAADYANLPQCTVQMNQMISQEFAWQCKQWKRNYARESQSLSTNSQRRSLHLIGSHSRANDTNNSIEQQLSVFRNEQLLLKRSFQASS